MYDTVPHYRLTSAIIQTYLEEIFGKYDFKVTVSPLALQTFRMLTESSNAASSRELPDVDPRTLTEVHPAYDTTHHPDMIYGRADQPLAA